MQNHQHAYRVVTVALATTKPDSDLEAAENFQQELLERYPQTYKLVKLAIASDRPLSDLEDAMTDLENALTDLENASVTQSDPATTRLGQASPVSQPGYQLGTAQSRSNSVQDQPASQQGRPHSRQYDHRATKNRISRCAKPRTAFRNSRLSRTKTPL